LPAKGPEAFYAFVRFVFCFVCLVVVSLFVCLFVCLFGCLFDRHDDCCTGVSIPDGSRAGDSTLDRIMFCLFVCLFVCLVGWLVGWLFVSSIVVVVPRDRFEGRLQYDCMFGTCELSPIFDIALGILSEL
jgi:hypothetical protein